MPSRTHSELQSLTDAEPTVESTTHLFEPEVARQEQREDQEPEPEPELDRDQTDNLDHPEELGDASLDTITPNDYAPADNLGELDSEKQDIADSMETDHTGTADGDHSSQQVQESELAHGHDEIKAPHWTEYADPHADPFVAFCKFFARGRCKNGALCTYRHALTVQEFLLLFRLEPLLWSSQISVPGENVQEFASVQPPLQPPHELPQLPLQTPSSFGACAFYPLGKCRNGEKCPFAHMDFSDAGEWLR